MSDRIHAEWRVALRERGLPRLTERECQVFALIAQGHKPKEIAGRLSISVLTTRTHIRNVVRKLGVSGSTAALVTLLRAGALAEAARRNT